MKFSVLIPAYNAAKTIDRTIESALNQSLPPFEILVVDDGSTDDTLAHLRAYHPKITVYPLTNAGVSPARNFLCERSQGDAIAFLDADDVWHPTYLETQAKMFAAHPEAAAGFARYISFEGDGDPAWPEAEQAPVAATETFEPVEFFRRYNRTPLYFIPSCCCIRRRVLVNMTFHPFPALIRSAEDFYLFNVLPLHGPIMHCQSKLVGYRMTNGSLCRDRLLNTARTVRGMELLAERGFRKPPPHFARAFKLAFATRRRIYAKYLMGAGKANDARRQIRLSLSRPGSLISILKSLGLYTCTLLPRQFQPKWPIQFRS